MNDSDDAIIGRAISARASAAPSDVPDFANVLSDRQSRMRRKTAAAAAVLVAIGVSGMAAFAVGGGEPSSTADGPVGSDDALLAPSTTPPSHTTPVDGTVPGETIWFCEGAVDRFTVLPATTTTSPPTTTILVDGSIPVPVDDTPFVPPLEDSGYFRDCHLVQADGGPAATSIDQFPTTTTTTTPPPGAAPEVTVTTLIVAPPITGEVTDDRTGSPQIYIVQAGDYAIRIADLFCVPLEDLLNFNGWATGSEFPFPGQEISIPPGGCVGPDGFTAPASTPGDDLLATTTTSLS